jgi:hypothetical protein
MGFGEIPYIVIDKNRNLTSLGNYILDNFEMVTCPATDILVANHAIQVYLNNHPGRIQGQFVKMSGDYPSIPLEDADFWSGYYDVLRATLVTQR